MEIGKQFHGTDVPLKPGDKVLPRSATGARINGASPRDTSGKVSSTAHLPEAARYGQRVYVVRPQGVLGQDPEYTGAAHRLHPQAAQGTLDSRSAVVEREVSPEAVARAKSFQPARRREGQVQPIGTPQYRFLGERRDAEQAAKYKRSRQTRSRG